MLTVATSHTYKPKPEEKERREGRRREAKEKWDRWRCRITSVMRSKRSGVLFYWRWREYVGVNRKKLMGTTPESWAPHI